METHSASKQTNTQRSRHHDRFTKLGSASEIRDSDKAAANPKPPDGSNQVPNEIVGARSYRARGGDGSAYKAPLCTDAVLQCQVEVFGPRHARHTAGVSRHP